jgi:hypothetical protein
MLDILMLATIIAPVTSGLVHVVKIAQFVDKKYLPLIAVIIGVALGASAVFLETELVIRMWAGGISGLAATGLFELSKKGQV